MGKVAELLKHYWKFALTVAVAVAALVLAFGLRNPTAAQWLVGVFGAGISLLLAVGMVQDIRNGSYGVDILAITAIVATLAVGQYWASLVIIVMLTGGEAIEDFAANRSRRELKALLDRAPQTAHLVSGDNIADVPIAKVKVGDILSIKPFEAVPVDGVLVSAAAEFDESSLTGESLPVAKKSGDKIMSGSLNGAEAVEIRATADAKHSQYEQIISLVREAESNPAPFVRMADRYAIPFTIISYAIAGTAWALTGDPVRFAEVLVLASPCPLILAAPIALISGMSCASKHGIIVKGGAVLEVMSAAKVIAFDKTGTLTRGNVVVEKIEPAKGFAEKEIVALAASSEAGSSHILASSLVQYAKEHQIGVVTPENVQETLGDGVSAMVGNKNVLVGKLEFLSAHGVENAADPHEDDTNSTSISVAVNGQYAGTIHFADQVRPEAKRTIKLLKKLGIQKTVMLTGDKNATAQAIGKTAGVDEVHSELLPVNKVEIVRDLHKQFGSVAMVGDGVNDAPVLAAADAGIAMGAHGSTAASESADAIIMLDDIGRVALLREISQHTIKIALQSVWFGIGLCIVLMLIAAATGIIPAIVGAGLQEVIDVAVIFNALRAHSGKK